jgi:hypothetical protein
MSAARAAPITTPDAKALTPARLAPLEVLCLMRASLNGGVTRAELTRDLKAIAGPTLAADAWRLAMNAALTRLTEHGLASEVRSRLTATDGGQAQSRRSPTPTPFAP